MSLSVAQINELEMFISKNIPRDPPALSPYHQELREKTFEKVKNGPIGSFEIFGGNGFSSYSFYKAQNEKLYLITSFIQELTSYSIIV